MFSQFSKKRFLIALALIGIVYYYTPIKQAFWSLKESIVGSAPASDEPIMPLDSIPEATPTDNASGSIDLHLNDSTELRIQANDDGSIQLNGKKLDKPAEQLPQALQEALRQIPEKDRPEALRRVMQQYLEQSSSAGVSLDSLAQSLSPEQRKKALELMEQLTKTR